MVITNEQLENIYNYIVNRSKKDTSFPTISYDNLGMFTVLDDKNQNSLLKKSEIEDKFSYLYYETNDLTSKYNNVSSDVNNIKNSYIAKGTTNKTFILDNGERATAIVDIDDEVEYDADSLHIDFITSDDDANSKIVHINSATQDRAGLMSAADKKIMDKAVLEGSDTSLNLIEDIEDIIGDSAEGLNISNLNGISALDNNNISVSSMLDIKEGMRVEDNKLASFGSRGILLNQGGIDFQYATNISHLVNSKAVNANYENGIACKEAFYVEDGIYVTGESYFNDAIHLNGNDVNLEGGIVDFQEGGFIHFNDVNIKEVTYLNTTGIGILSNDRTKGVIYSPIDNKLIFKNKTNSDDNITYIYDTGELNFNINCYLYGSLITNGSEIEIRNTNNECLLYCDGDSDINIYTPVEIDSTLTATEVDTQKLLCSETTDKVTESSSVTKDNINVSYSGNNINNNTTMTKDGITVSSENGFTGTSKGSYQAGGLSVSNTDIDGVKSSVSVHNDKISFTENNKTINITQKNNSLKIDNSIYCNGVYCNSNSSYFQLYSSFLRLYDKYAEFTRNLVLESNRIRISGGKDDTTIEISNSAKGIMINHQNSNINNTKYQVNVKHTLYESSIKYTKIDDTNVVKEVYSDPNQIYISNKTSEVTDKINIEPTGINLYVQDKNNNNNINTYLDADKVAIETTNTNTNITNNIELNHNGLLLQKSNVDKDFINADITNQTLEVNEFNSITIENTNTSANKDIDIKNYDVLINDNSRLGFKYNNEVYVFNTQKAIELGLLTKA